MVADRQITAGDGGAGHGCADMGAGNLEIAKGDIGGMGKPRQAETGESGDQQSRSTMKSLAQHR